VEDDVGQQPRGRLRRRAVGPAGAVPSGEPLLHLATEHRPEPADDDERLRRDLPPHHDRGV
jgi:hypothetical protein